MTISKYRQGVIRKPLRQINKFLNSKKQVVIFKKLSDTNCSCLDIAVSLGRACESPNIYWQGVIVTHIHTCTPPWSSVICITPTTYSYEKTFSSPMRLYSFLHAPFLHLIFTLLTTYTTTGKEHMRLTRTTTIKLNKYFRQNKQTPPTLRVSYCTSGRTFCLTNRNKYNDFEA